MTEDYCITTAGVIVKGRTEFKNWVSGFQKLLSEAKNEIIDIFFNEAQDKVVSRWVCRGKITTYSDCPQMINLFLSHA